MGDTAFALWSVLAALVFFPVLFILPVFARKRAWRKRAWFNFAEFEQVQRKWDIAGIIFLIVSLILLYWLTEYTLRMVASALGVSNLDPVQVRQQLQSILSSP
ncbi:hypothetical protein KGQ71_04670 [Patescibacteria group bacterium]|nr:hypothetical protein [Patescibacteria group bacterium]